MVSFSDDVATHNSTDYMLSSAALLLWCYTLSGSDSNLTLHVSCYGLLALIYNHYGDS